ncbi:Hypothetical predicted protein [Mytilus galloprovincialis]|uniref:EB domain-containing protein n=2 Tax=Mytilus galloprovincialis TaxID=29158 RepID=A0A8B6D147_MYTGA|nr:Hypothetical predicted protein [Mytilus galloprovincialis]
MGYLYTVVLLILPLIALYFQFAVSAGVPVGEACTNTSNCTDNIANTECKGGKCQCVITHYQIKNTCVDKVALGASCNATMPCLDTNSKCEKTCVCKDSFYKDTTSDSKCKPSIYPNVTCGTPKNESCVVNAYCNSTSFCVCEIGFTATKTSCK